MTCREKLQLENPCLALDSRYSGGCPGCPSDRGYLENPDYCPKGKGVKNSEWDKRCTMCWDREVER